MPVIRHALPIWPSLSVYLPSSAAASTSLQQDFTQAVNQTTVNTLPPEDTLPPEMWSRIIKTAIASTPAQDIQGWKHLSGNLLVSHQFKALTERLPEYKLLKYILPILQKKLKAFYQIISFHYRSGMKAI